MSHRKLIHTIATVAGVALAIGITFDTLLAGGTTPPAALRESMFEFVGQVKNLPPEGPGLPATSVQYGYLSHIQGLTDDQIYLPGPVQSETTALFTFYNDSVTEKVTNHGSLRIVIREGTTTVYYNALGGGDFNTPLPDSFRQGMPVLTSVWRHQVVLDGSPSPDPAAPARTNLFFVTWWHTVTGARVADLGTAKVLLGRAGESFEQHLVGGVDFTGAVNGKFAGYSKAPLPVLVLKTAH